MRYKGSLMALTSKAMLAIAGRQKHEYGLPENTGYVLPEEARDNVFVVENFRWGGEGDIVIVDPNSGNLYLPFGAYDDTWLQSDGSVETDNRILLRKVDVADVQRIGNHRAALADLDLSQESDANNILAVRIDFSQMRPRDSEDEFIAPYEVVFFASKERGAAIQLLLRQTNNALSAVQSSTPNLQGVDHQP